MIANTALTHQKPAAEVPPRRDDGGFILITLGLLIIPIMIFAALAIDISSWYTRASQLQKAADAASLAGVVYLPGDQATAKSTALASIRRNGLTLGGQVTATVEVTANNQLKVTVVDNNAQQFFSQVFSGKETITRSATAQYVQPVPLGSPFPYLGGDCVATQASPLPGNPASSIIPPSQCPGLWLGIMGPLNTSANGDAYNTACYANQFTGGNGHVLWPCTNTLPLTVTPPANNTNMQYNNGAGEWYQIKVPQNYSGGQMNVRVFDAGYYPTRAANGNYSQAGSAVQDGPAGTLGFDSTHHVPPGAATIFNYQMFNNGSDPYNPINNGPMSASDCGGGSGNAADSGSWSFNFANSGNPPSITPSQPYGPAADVFRQKWATICTISNPQPGGTYFLRASSALDQTNPNAFGLEGTGVNHFALDVTDASGSSTNWPAVGSPTISGLNNMVVVNHVDNTYTSTCTLTSIPAGSTCISFYLAEIGQQYAGHKVAIQMWDVGDAGGNGTGSLELNAPPSATGLVTGPDAVPNCVQVSKSSGFTSTKVLSGTNAAPVAVPCNIMTYTSAGGIPTPFGGSTSGTPYRTTWLEFDVSLPANYTCPAAQPLGCWWKVSYIMTGQAQALDTTTWQVYSPGDPVHIVQ